MYLPGYAYLCVSYFAEILQADSVMEYRAINLIVQIKLPTTSVVVEEDIGG